MDIPTAKGQRVLLIPRTVIDNKHRDTHFIVILSNAGFFEFAPRDLQEITKIQLVLRLSRAGFPIFGGASAAIAELLYLVFGVKPKPSPPMNLPALMAGSTTTTSKRTYNANDTRKAKIRER